MILKKFTQEWLNFDDEQISLLEELNNYRFEKYSENFELNDVNDVNKYFDFVVEIERKVMEML